MGRRKLIADSSKLKAHSAGPRVIATGRISRGVSVTYVAFPAMPTADEICDAAIRKVVRELKAPRIERSRIQELRD